MTAIDVDYTTKILTIAPSQEDLEDSTNLTTIFGVTDITHTKTLNGKFFVTFYGPGGVKGSINNVNWIVQAIKKKRI